MLCTRPDFKNLVRTAYHDTKVRKKNEINISFL